MYTIIHFSLPTAENRSNDIAYLNILEGETSPTNHLSKNTENTTNTIGVQVMMGDTLAKQLNQYPNFIKIDVEGFEVEVLKGMREVLSSEKLHSIFIEVHFRLLKEAGNPYGSQTIIKILKDYNFKVKWIDFSHVMGIKI
ncbi:MAG: FkbM family methyltransferase [Snowella sp.]|nr:FkbM family methyltransferase [Snowella sp.]